MVPLMIGKNFTQVCKISVVLNSWYPCFTGWSRIHQKRQQLIANSSSAATKQTRLKHWGCYRRFCAKYGLNPIPCSFDQAASYISFLSECMKLSSISTYYQAVRYFHVIFGLQAPPLSHPYLGLVMGGIANSPAGLVEPKDPFQVEHLMTIFSVVCVETDVHLLTWIAILLMFHSLLRVSHVVFSPHTLQRGDVEFKRWGVLLRIRSAKTLKRGADCMYIPLVKRSHFALCPVNWLSYLMSTYPRGLTDPLFSTIKLEKFTYEPVYCSFLVSQN